MIDRFQHSPLTISGPATDAWSVVPSDTDDLEHVTRAISVTATGTVRVTTMEGTDVTLFIAAGAMFSQRARRIWATGTDALGIVGHI